MVSSQKIRKWSEEYIKYGFTKLVINGVERPQCILCNATFSNANLKPSKLHEHFSIKHGGDTKFGNDIESLKSKRARFDLKITLPKLGFVPLSKPILLASYKIAYEVAKQKKPHNIAENLIKPCMFEAAKIILGEASAQQLQAIPLSNNVIRNRIDDLGADILDQVLSDIKASPIKISIQLDESTDVENCSQLIAFVRYIKNNAIEEDFLFCKPLQTTTTALDVYNLVVSFFNNNDIPLQVIGSICTDGAPAMLGNRSGFVTLMKKQVPGITATHCILHRQALMSKTMPLTMRVVMDSCIKIVNFIRGRAMNHRLFKAFCSELNDEASVLLYHTEVRWLSRGRALSRFFELRIEIEKFLGEQKSDLVDSFYSPNFCLILAYMSDIFQHINELNFSLQGKGIHIITASEKLRAFREKIKLWISRIKNNNFCNFPSLEDIISNDPADINVVKLNITEHLNELRNSFDGYFKPGDLTQSETWIVNPFAFNLEAMNDDDDDIECLIELRSSHSLKLIFDSSVLEDFWCYSLLPFPTLSKKALQVLVPFSTTWLCETGFSSLLHIKSKFRNSLNPENDLRIALSKKQPRFDKIIINKRQENSQNT